MSETYNFNERLKRTRMQAGLSGKELAKKAGIPYSTYMAYENKNRQPLAENLAKIAAALGVTSEYLLQDTNYIDYRKLKTELSKAIEAESKEKQGSSTTDFIDGIKTVIKQHIENDNSIDIYPVFEELKKLLSSNKNIKFDGELLDDETRKYIYTVLSFLQIDLVFGQSDIRNNQKYKTYQRLNIFSESLNEVGKLANFAQSNSTNTADENEHNAPPADIEENKAHKKSVD